MGGSAESVYSRCRRRKVWQSIGSEWDAYGTRPHLPGSLDAPTPMYPMSFPLTPHYRNDGSIISANEFRARFSLDFTVPRLQCVISAISSYERPSISRKTNTSR
jgi:hypothetical protein